MLVKANRNRAPSDKVYIDSIIVTPTKTNITDNSPVTPEGVLRLRECPELQATEINTIIDFGQADSVALSVVGRLDKLARRGQDATDRYNSGALPSVPNPNSPDQRTIRVIDSRGEPIKNRTFTLRFSRGQSDISAPTSNGTGTIVLPAGVYSLSISSSASPPQTLEITIGPSSTDIVVTSD